MPRYLSILSILCSVQFGLSQSRIKLDVLLGTNYSWVKNKVLHGEQPAYGLKFGAGTTINFKQSKISITSNIILLSQKGYRQIIDKDYFIRYNYQSLQLLANYQLTKHIQIHTGIEFSLLGGTNVEGGTETYRKGDVGIVVGLRLFDNRLVAIDLQTTQGLTTILDYYKIDRQGNMTPIADLKNRCISLSIRYRIIK